jgi:N-acetyl-gamma-glutamyl-phosphate reductase
VAAIHNPHVRVIDASSAHRTTPGWVYGLPELDEQQAERIAQHAGQQPGCYPTGAIACCTRWSRLAVACGLPLSIHAVSGYSGGGRGGRAARTARRRQSAGLQLYGLELAHKHVPEIQQHAGLSARPMFMPGYGAYRQGIVLSIPLQLRLLPGQAAPNLQACLEQHYQGARHVQVMPLHQAALRQTSTPRH